MRRQQTCGDFAYHNAYVESIHVIFGPEVCARLACIDVQSMEHSECYPEGCATTGVVPCQRNARELQSKLLKYSLPRKIVVTSKPPVGDISVVTLIRTDTTLDHSQKAEKVCCRS